MTTTKDFYLIQRLTAKLSHGPGGAQAGDGFDAFFGLDYMGSSEYEFGTPNLALESLRAEGTSELFEATVVFLDEPFPVFFVAPLAGIDEKISVFVEYLGMTDDRWKNKERPWFEEALLGYPGPYDDHKKTIVAWWAFDANLMWTLDREIAAALVLALIKKDT